VRTLASATILAHVFLVPVLANGLRHFRQPDTVFGHFRDLCRRKELAAVSRRVP